MSGLEEFINTRFYGKRYNDNDLKFITHKNLRGAGIITEFQRAHNRAVNTLNSLKTNTEDTQSEISNIKLGEVKEGYSQNARQLGGTNAVYGRGSVPLLPPQIDMSIYATKQDIQALTDLVNKSKITNDDVYLNIQDLQTKTAELFKLTEILKNDDIKIYTMVKQLNELIPQLKSGLSNVEYFINKTSDKMINYKQALNKFK